MHNFMVVWRIMNCNQAMTNNMQTLTRALVAPLLLLWGMSAQALEIDSLIKAADDSGSAVFSVKNINDYRVFLNVGMFELQVENGELKEIPYTRDNIKDWKINVRPARTIIDKGFVKDFRVSMNCGTKCNKDKDQLFTLAFVPTPYVKETDLKQHMVQMAIGFSPIFIFPGADQPLNYSVNYQGNDLNFINHNDTYINVIVNGCGKGYEWKEGDDCRQTVRVLGGRHFTYTLPESLRKPSLNLTIKTHRSVYHESVDIKKG